MKHLATFRNLTLISGLYLGLCRKWASSFIFDWYQSRPNQHARYESRCGMHKPRSTWFDLRSTWFDLRSVPFELRSGPYKKIVWYNTRQFHTIRL